MFVNAKAVALLLATSVSLITTAFLSLLSGTPQLAVFVSGVLSFGACFVLTFVTFEFLIFREVNSIYNKFSKIKKREFGHEASLDTTAKNANNNFFTNPIRQVNEEIAAYTSEKQHEIEKLKKVEQYRREFIADVSHELKTPLFAAQGFIHTLLDGAINDETVRSMFLEKAAKNLDSLTRLVKDLLTLSQIESGAISMLPDTFNLHELCKDVLEQLDDQAAKRHVQCKLILKARKTDGDTPFNVWADEHRIKQVLINLVINAIKYGREQGNVWVELKANESSVKVTVKDDGHGIDPEHLSRIFERFYRVEKSRSKMQGGTGLGLAITKHILEKHNSRINVSSQVGLGTTFSFRLPKSLDGENT
ncbi:MAG: two-component sensor histidine kinase [Cytophagales bacterium]|nr:MAG: two-component sensor histidine kinase [Cytophagales bacterium]TAF61484.1 MAG: two-component sensor histidine kinase [Cytophagales bacterium]